MYPHERSLVKRLANQPFALIGVNSDKRERALEAMARENITWPSFFNGGTTRGPISKAWGVHAWPTIYVLDHQGVIRFKNVRGEAMSTAVDKLIKEARTALATDIKSTDAAVRGIAAFRMGKYHVAGALATIKPLLRDQNLQVQQRAALGLVQLGQPSGGLLERIRAAAADPDTEVCIAALQALGSAKDHQSLALIVGAARDPRVAVRRAAVQVLGNLQDPKAVPALVTAAGDSDLITARNAAYALADIKTADAVTALKKLAEESANPNRVWVAVALQRAGEPGSVERFRKLLADPEPKIRRQVVTVLPTLADFDPLDLMLGVLEDKDLQVGKKVREYLAQSKSPRARKALRDYLQKRIDQLIPIIAGRDYRKQGPARAELLTLGPAAAPLLLARIDKSLPPMAAYTLGNAIGALGNPEVLAPVAKKLQDPKLAPAVRSAYESILRAFGTKARGTVKELIASDHGAVRLSAVRALLTARDSGAVEILKAELKDPDLNARAYAAYALAMRHDSAALPVLKDLVARQNPAQLQLAAFGLYYFGEDTALPLLVKLLSSENKTVRAIGVTSLGRFRSARATDAIVQAGADRPELRGSVMSSLYRQRTSDAARALGKFLKSDDAQVRKQALQWLERMRVATARQIVRNYKKQQAQGKGVKEKQDQQKELKKAPK